ncbi:hypothetical protein FQA47_013884 [Oryzias melastigma]|uniref:Uncharacterized protein n=1 Tax=Oryzias melastigma TaxID=30732 RepID=A0A834F0M4_ORYME|nr:hypothetical protein FQA47_013884 [Oryzias melastigma]
MCVCTVCTLIGSHRDHVCISIREAERELRGNLKEEIKQLQDTEEQVKTRVSHLGEKKETSRIVLTEAQESCEAAVWSHSGGFGPGGAVGSTVHLQGGEKGSGGP